MAESSSLTVLADHSHGPLRSDLDKCVHCGLCLNACPTYRELGVEMDSPRGRIYQMVQVADGAPITDAYIEHMSLCLGCRGCETACPSGVPYGRLIEGARAQLESQSKRSFLNRLFRTFIFEHFIPSRSMMQIAGAGLYLYQASGMQRLLRSTGVLKVMGSLSKLEALTPNAEVPFFFPQIGKTFPAEGEQRYRVAFLAGCIANVAFARLNEATIRVLQKNGCEVVIPGDQTCCGALAVHSGMREQARKLARQNVDAVLSGEYDAIITNAAGCGSTLKEYDELLEDDPGYRDQAHRFTGLMRDITEFLASIELRPGMNPVHKVVTYQDSCHLAHGQKISAAPRKLLRGIPGLTYHEMPSADVCCGSAGIYNIVHNELAMSLLQHKMEIVNAGGAQIVATANPGCMLQLAAGCRLFGQGQRVMHVVELLDEAYSNPKAG
jgi:glycolate oxidase iron-sulfur subunit